MSRANVRDAKERAGVSVGGVIVTHPAKVLFPDDNVTKEEMVEYYSQVAPLMLKEIKNRPLMLLRCPQGRGRSCFFQKHFDEGTLDLKTIKIKEDDGSLDNYVYVTTPREIIELAQLNTIEFHTWGSKVPKPEVPDRIVFDLDPSPEIKSASVIKLALSLRDFLNDFGLKSFPRLSGGKGIHLVIPIARRYSWPDVRLTSEALIRVFGQEVNLVTTELSKAKRKGKVFVDYLRNARGATCIANYSLRARAGARVAVPITWDELTPRTKFDKFTMASVLKRIDEVKDPWPGISSLLQKLPKLDR